MSVALSESRYIFGLNPSSRSDIFFLCFLSILLCYLCFRICSKIVLCPCYWVDGMSLCIIPLLAGRIFFRCFGTSSFVSVVISIRNIVLVFLFSPVAAVLFP